MRKCIYSISWKKCIIKWTHTVQAWVYSLLSSLPVSTARVFTLGTVNLWLSNSLMWDAILFTEGCLAISLASTTRCQWCQLCQPKWSADIARQYKIDLYWKPLFSWFCDKTNIHCLYSQIHCSNTIFSLKSLLIIFKKVISLFISLTSNIHIAW